VSSISATVASSRHPGLAALSLCSGVMIFSGQDWIIKFLSGDYPVHQAIAIRGVVAMVILFAFIAYAGKLASLRSKRMGLLIVRGLVLMVAYTTYYLAFPSMPLANVVALWFTVPLFVTALAGPFLGEKVGARRWIAENKTGLKKYNKLMKADLNHKIEKVGVKLRERMPWLSDER